MGRYICWPSALSTRVFRQCYEWNSNETSVDTDFQNIKLKVRVRLATCKLPIVFWVIVNPIVSSRI